MSPYSLEELSKEDADNLTEELKAVLEKYGAEMGVKSNIELLKRVYPSPLDELDNGNPEEAKTD